jgi:CheY-like chemotaxis protein
MASAAVYQHPNADPMPTILAVEDEVLTRMVLADQLRDAGYTVIEASSAYEALEVVRHPQIVVNLLSSDVRLPGVMDGVSLARTVRFEFPAIKIILTSGHQHALDWADHDGFFAKPYDLNSVVDHVRMLVTSHARG